MNMVELNSSWEFYKKVIMKVCSSSLDNQGICNCSWSANRPQFHSFCFNNNSSVSVLCYTVYVLFHLDLPVFLRPC